MAKEVVTHAWCDLCMDEDDREPATRIDNVVTLGVKKVKPRSLDLCDRHYKELVEPLERALEEYGVPVHAQLEPHKPHTNVTDQVPGPFWCQVPGCDNTKPLASVGSVYSHIKRKHDLKRREYVKTYGPLVPAGRPGPAVTVAPPDEKSYPTSGGQIGESEAKCQVEGCGKVYSHELGHTRPVQALGVHLARTHGIRSAKAKL